MKNIIPNLRGLVKSLTTEPQITYDPTAWTGRRDPNKAARDRKAVNTDGIVALFPLQGRLPLELTRANSELIVAEDGRDFILATFDGLEAGDLPRYVEAGATFIFTRVDFDVLKSKLHPYRGQAAGSTRQFFINYYGLKDWILNNA